MKFQSRSSLLLASASLLILTGCQTLSSDSFSDSFEELLSLDDKITAFFSNNEEEVEEETGLITPPIETEEQKIEAVAPEDESTVPKIEAITLPVASEPQKTEDKVETESLDEDLEKPADNTIESGETKVIEAVSLVPKTDPNALVSYRSYSGTKKIPASFVDTELAFDTDGMQPMGVSLRVLRDLQPDLGVRQEERNARSGKGSATRILPSLPQSIQMKGSLAETLDVISSRYGYAWRFDRAAGGVVFYRYHDTDFVKTWQFDPEGGRIRNWAVDATRHLSVRDVLVDWCRQTGWKCVWNSDKTPTSITNSNYFRGNFSEALVKLDRSFQGRNRLIFDVDDAARIVTIR